MKRVVSVLMVAILAVPMAAATALAQMQPSPAKPGAPPTSQRPAEKSMQEVEGTVKKVDAMAKTVEVSRLFGIMGTKLEVNEETKIRAGSKDVTISEIREGAKIKAAYESQAGKNLAKSIEVLPEEKKEPAASPPTAPGARPGPKTQ